MYIYIYVYIYIHIIYIYIHYIYICISFICWFSTLQTFFTCQSKTPAGLGVSDVIDLKLRWECGKRRHTREWSEPWPVKTTHIPRIRDDVQCPVTGWLENLSTTDQNSSSPPLRLMSAPHIQSLEARSQPYILRFRKCKEKSVESTSQCIPTPFACFQLWRRLLQWTYLGPRHTWPYLAAFWDAGLLWNPRALLFALTSTRFTLKGLLCRWTGQHCNAKGLMTYPAFLEITWQVQNFAAALQKSHKSGLVTNVTPKWWKSDRCPASSPP